MAGKAQRTTWRTTLVLMACGLVIAASWVLTPPFDAGENEREVEQHLTNRPPTPGSEAALRQAIVDMRRGQPDYARMSKEMADLTHVRLARFRQMLAALGPLQSLRYVGGTPRPDFYRVNFQNGSQLWGIYIDKSGLTEGLNVEKAPEPQDYIDGYASFSAGVRAMRWAEQFAILLAAALFGRLALRLRL
jgi:hypothetical protein